MQFICKYCGKEIGNKGCLILHERHCVKNPNHQLSKTQIRNEERNSRRDATGKIAVKKKFNHSEETKKLLSQKRKQWLKEHKDKHPWKSNTKFESKPCEKLKEYLHDKGINFVDEWEPFDDIYYSIDIAWPDEKIGIEVNGNQHYTREGTLTPYYQKRHDLIVAAGWKLFEIPYSYCYNLNDEKFEELFKLSIYDKDYKEYVSKKKQRQLEKKQELEQKVKQRNLKHEFEHNIILDLINNSGIDFSKNGWTNKALIYVNNQNKNWNSNILKVIRRYEPNFLKQDNVWKRKGTIY
jgi:very-short-patch-repair endonuclease